MFGSVTVAQERSFEQKNIVSKSARYLSTDVLQKVKTDPGYAAKVCQIQNALGTTKGWILDVGANTCGESEFLTTLGYLIIATDINQFALGLSKERCARFERKPPHYLACDGHRLPLEGESVQFVIFNEALHHMADPFRAMQEAARVLLPGGRVFLYEPYAFNPYRRLSEIRDYFRGAIERSFSVKKLQHILASAGLKPLSVRRHTYPASEWKMQAFSVVHRVSRRFYVSAAKALPLVFGDVMVVAEKPGKLDPAEVTSSIGPLLRCPVSGARLIEVFDGSGFVSLDETSRVLYPTHQGIPVLIREEAKQLDKITWQALARRASRPAAQDSAKCERRKQ